MGLVLCCACDRQRVISPVDRNINICSNCRAKNPRIIHRQKIWKNWEENVGIIKIEAMRRVYAGLRWLQINKHFKPKYPDAKFMSIYEIWPPDEIVGVSPYAPTANLVWWLARANAKWKAQKRLEEKQKAPETVLRLPEPSSAACTYAGGQWTSSFMTPEDWDVKL